MSKKIIITEKQANLFKNFILENISFEEITQEACNADTNPTDAQKEKGNYKKGHVNVRGFKITIENAKGSIRRYKNEDGTEGKNIMKNHYGYFSRTKGKDGDHVDVFIGNYLDFDKIYVVDQINPKSGEFDESKVMLGFKSIESAKAAYLSNFDKNWKGFKTITGVSVPIFKKWLYRQRKQRKPFSEYVHIIKNKMNESKKTTKQSLNEEMCTELYDMFSEYTASDVLWEFLEDKKNGILERKWRLIPKEPYWNALRGFMQYGEAFRTPEYLINDWLQVIYYNVITLTYITELAGHSQHFPFDDFNDVFFYENEDEAPNDYYECSEYLDNLGFYDWCKLPDGSDAWSDYGLEPLWKIITSIKDDSTKGEKLVAINRCLDVIHCRGDLASMFIEGGRKSCYDISHT